MVLVSIGVVKMIRILSIALLAASFAWAGAVRAGDGPGKKTEATGALTGRVVDLQGRSVAGAEVWGVFRRNRVATARTGADGRFRLGPIGEDKPIDLWFEAPGFARRFREGLHVFAGRDRDLGDLKALPGTRIRGRLVDAVGKPIPGVRIAIQDYRFILGHTVNTDQLEWTIAGDADGRFVTPPLPSGKVIYRFASPGKVRTILDKWAEPGVEMLDLGDVVLPDEVPIRGVVLDQDGRPAPGVEVIVEYDHDNAVKTDASGRFTVLGAGKDAKVAFLRSNEYFAPSPRLELGPDHDHVKLTVTKAYQIHGSAVDAETGKPVDIDTVRLCIVDRDPDGTYTLRG